MGYGPGGIKMKKNSLIAIAVILALNICFTAGLAVFVFNTDRNAPDGPTDPNSSTSSSLPEDPKGQGILDYQASQETLLFVGTNDKDTYEPVIPYEEAKTTVEKILASHGIEDFTVFEAQGGWVDPKGIPTYEKTLVYILYTTDEQLLKDIGQEICITLNQTSVVIQRIELDSCMYFGDFENAAA